jgi:hypothetical protein
VAVVGPIGVTVAVKVTLEPYRDGFCDEVTTVSELASLILNVPLVLLTV